MTNELRIIYRRLLGDYDWVEDFRKEGSSYMLVLAHYSMWPHDPPTSISRFTITLRPVDEQDENVVHK